MGVHENKGTFFGGTLKGILFYLVHEKVTMPIWEFSKLRAPIIDPPK